MALNIFEWIEKLSTTMIVLTIVALVTFGFLLLYFKFWYKPKTEIRHFELYENFQRKNVDSYIPIRWVKDGVILLDDDVTYVGILLCKGFDFFFAHPREQLDANLGYVDFVQSISQKIQLRMSNKQEDLEKPIAAYYQEKLRVERKLIDVLDEAVMMESSYDNIKDEETRAEYAKRLTEYDRLVKNLEWESRHIEQIIEYMKEISSTNAAPIRETCYVIDWVYNSNEFPEGTTEQEIFQRAKKELKAKADSMAFSLSACNVKVTRANNREVQELIRGHMQPYGKNIYKSTDVENSNYDELVVTSNSLQEAKRNYEEFVQKINMYEQRRIELEALEQQRSDMNSENSEGGEPFDVQ